MFADDFLLLKIDVEEMANGEKVDQQLRGTREDGIPWITILDGDGAELVTSDGPNGNIGCPISEEECAFFVSMIKQTVRHSPEGRVAEIANALDAFAQKKR